MNSHKLAIRNVKKNIHDYFVYFLTLTISISLFYAFNSIADQPAFSEMGATKALLYEQLGILLSALSFVIAVVLGFLIIYANQFLLKRRKKELGIYMMCGMRKGRISRIFAGETLYVGVISLVAGLLLGLILSQGISLVALKLFAIEIANFRFVVSGRAAGQTVLCFAVIFVLVLLFNVRSVSSVKLIDLFTASRKNERFRYNKPLTIVLFFLSLVLLVVACVVFSKYGILPSRENWWFQIGGVSLIAGTVLFFYSISVVVLGMVRANKNFYLKGLNAFLARQVGSKIHTNYIILAIICGLLTVTICAVSVGVSTAVAMNDLSQAATPYDLNVLSSVSRDGDTDIAGFLFTQGVDIDTYAEKKAQISLYDADMTYGDLLEGQDVNLWRIDKDIPGIPVSVVSIADFNKALAMQGKEPFSLGENEYLLNCNYEGTIAYMDAALANHPALTIAGTDLLRASDVLLNETYFMTTIGNNDRGTLIVPESVANMLPKANNVLLAQYADGTDANEVLQQMIPIGLDDTHGYRYAEKNMMYDMFYGTSALMAFLCCYVGLVFLLICAALLALKQLTETTDNIHRYGLLQKLGAGKRQVHRTLLIQTAVFFAAPLALAGVFSAVLLNQAIQIVEGFMNIHISTNMIFAVILIMVVYGVYFIATYLSCKRMVGEKRIEG